jgi:membrane dipeptidase
MTLTWCNTNDWADSSLDEERWGGLTQFGHEVVREMNRIGMIVDISHVSDKTFWQTLRTSSKPIIASHSSVRSICEHPRNMSDEMIKALAEKGGVMFINFYPAFINENFSQAREKAARRMQRKLDAAMAHWPNRPEMYTYEEERLLRGVTQTLPEVNIDQVVGHIEYAARIAGVDAVGFGSDFDGIPSSPLGLEDCRSFPQLCDRLRKRGFKPSEVRKIAGENFLRLFSDVVG